MHYITRVYVEQDLLITIAWIMRNYFVLFVFQSKQNLLERGKFKRILPFLLELIRAGIIENLNLNFDRSHIILT